MIDSGKYTRTELLKLRSELNKVHANMPVPDRHPARLALLEDIRALDKILIKRQQREIKQ